MMDDQKFTFRDLINKQEDNLLYSLPVYDHLIDSKRDGNKLVFIIPPFQESCFEVSLVEKNTPVYISMHTTIEFCPLTYCFLLLQALFLFYPRGFLYEILAIYICALFIGGSAALHPYLAAYSQCALCQKLGHFIGLPALRFSNLLYMTALHAFKPLFNLMTLGATWVVTKAQALPEQFRALVANAPLYWDLCTVYVEQRLALAKELVCLYWRELTVTAVAVLAAVYIVVPSRGSQATMRLVCVVGLAMALVYVSSSLALKIVGGSVVLSACVMKMMELAHKF